MITAMAVIANIILAGIIFAFAKPIATLPGKTGIMPIAQIYLGHTIGHADSMMPGMQQKQVLSTFR